MTLPTITPFTSDTSTSAATVYTNDSALTLAFGNLDTDFNISNTKSPVVIGPIRGLVAGSDTLLFKWLAPADFELWEMHVSPMAALDGTTANATLSAAAKVPIQVANDGSVVASVTPNSLTESFVVSMSALAGRTVSSGDVVAITTGTISGVPSYHAAITIFGYMKHRS